MPPDRAPIAGQLAHGVPWSLVTVTGVVLGIFRFFRVRERQPTPRATAVQRVDRPAATGAP